MRGSTPCHGEAIARYGGNTSCVSVDAEGQEPLLLDLGTGLRYYGLTLPKGEPFRGSCLLSHLHWDHLQGLPFFSPLHQRASRLHIYAPALDDDHGSIADVVAATISPPLFPVNLRELGGEITFTEVADSTFSIGDYEVTSREVPHVGPTCGYRIELGGTTIAYISDHQQPIDGSFSIADGAMELCRGADLLIHDAQYTATEFAAKRDWGHCMIEYAVWVAGKADVERLVLFHHDPSHDDDQLDALAAGAVACGRERGVDVIAAREGLTLTVGG